jgi:hypothetical protein
MKLKLLDTIEFGKIGSVFTASIGGATTTSAEGVASDCEFDPQPQIQALTKNNPPNLTNRMIILIILEYFLGTNHSDYVITKLLNSRYPSKG